MGSELFAIQRIEHSFAFLNLFHRKLFNAVWKLRGIQSPTACCAAEHSQDIALTTRHYSLILFPSIASCLRRFFPLPAAVQNGNYIHVFILFSQIVQPWLEVVVPPRNFGLIEDDLGLRCAIVHNSMSGGIYIDQQLFFTPDLVRFYAFLEYRIICLFHVIVGGIL